MGPGSQHHLGKPGPGGPWQRKVSIQVFRTASPGEPLGECRRTNKANVTVKPREFWGRFAHSHTVCEGVLRHKKRGCLDPDSHPWGGVVRTQTVCVRWLGNAAGAQAVGTGHYYHRHQRHSVQGVSQLLIQGFLCPRLVPTLEAPALSSIYELFFWFLN